MLTPGTCGKSPNSRGAEISSRRAEEKKAARGLQLRVEIVMDGYTSLEPAYSLFASCCLERYQINERKRPLLEQIIECWAPYMYKRQGASLFSEFQVREVSRRATLQVFRRAQLKATSRAKATSLKHVQNAKLHTEDTSKHELNTILVCMNGFNPVIFMCTLFCDAHHAVRRVC